MNYTEHFNLNKADSTDLFNELTINNPAMDKVDAQMFKNQNAAFSTAEHTKAGNVHVIVETITTCPVFRFIASADYRTGDTFTVNGASVSARLSNGTAIPDLGFVINANVMCVLNGGILTVILPGADLTADVASANAKITALEAATKLNTIPVTVNGAYTFSGMCFKVGKVVTLIATVSANSGNFGDNFLNETILDMPLAVAPSIPIRVPCTFVGDAFAAATGVCNVLIAANGLSTIAGFAGKAVNCGTVYAIVSWTAST